MTLTIKNMLRSNFTESGDIVVLVCLSKEEEVFIFWEGVLYNLRQSHYLIGSSCLFSCLCVQFTLFIEGSEDNSELLEAF